MITKTDQTNPPTIMIRSDNTPTKNFKNIKWPKCCSSNYDQRKTRHVIHYRRTYPGYQSYFEQLPQADTFFSVSSIPYPTTNCGHHRHSGTKCCTQRYFSDYMNK